MEVPVLEFVKMVPTNFAHYQKYQVFKMMHNDTKFILGYIYEDKIGFNFRPEKDVIFSFPHLQEITQFMEELERVTLYERIAD